TWGPIGAAVAYLTEVLDYTKERILFGRPVAATQSAQIKMADMARRITTAQLLSLQLGRLKDAGTMKPQQVSLAKWNNCRMAIDIARECRDLLGGAGITTEHAAIRHALNLESVITYEGTETVHQLVIGRELTGINAFWSWRSKPIAGSCPCRRPAISTATRKPSPTRTRRVTSAASSPVPAPGAGAWGRATSAPASCRRRTRIHPPTSGGSRARNGKRGAPTPERNHVQGRQS